MATPNYAWTGKQSLAMPSVSLGNPNQGLQVAQNGARNLIESENFDEEMRLKARQADQVEDYNQRRLSLATRSQDFAEGAGGRRVAEEAAAHKLGQTRRADTSNLLNDAVQANYQSQFDNYQIDPENARKLAAQHPSLDPNGPEMQDMLSAQRLGLQKTPSAYTDPAKLVADVSKKMRQEGRDPNTWQPELSEIINSKWPTLSEAQQKTLADLVEKPLRVTDFVGKSSGSGTGSYTQSASEQRANAAYVDKVIDERGIRKGDRGWSWNIGDVDIYEDSYKKGLGDVQTKYGVSAPFYDAAVDILAKDNTLKFDLGKMTEGEDGTLQKVGNLARTLQDNAQQRIGGGNGLAGLGAENVMALVNASKSGYDQRINNIFSKGTPQPATAADRYKILSEGIGVGEFPQEYIDGAGTRRPEYVPPKGAEGSTAVQTLEGALAPQGTNIYQDTASLLNGDKSFSEAFAANVGALEHKGEYDDINLDKSNANIVGQLFGRGANLWQDGAARTAAFWPTVAGQVGDKMGGYANDLYQGFTGDNQPTAQADAPILPQAGAAQAQGQGILPAPRPDNAPDFRNPAERILGDDPRGPKPGPAGPSNFAIGLKEDKILSVTGTGINKTKFEKGLNANQREAYDWARDPSTPTDDSVKIVEELRKGKTPNIPGQEPFAIEDPQVTGRLLDTAANIGNGAVSSQAGLLPTPEAIGGPQFDENIAARMNLEAEQQVAASTEAAIAGGATIKQINDLLARGGMPNISVRTFNMLKRQFAKNGRN